MNYSDAVREIYYWQYSNTGSFYNILVTLYQKADPTNKMKLAQAYPTLAAAFSDWCEHGCTEEFFRERGAMQ